MQFRAPARSKRDKRTQDMVKVSIALDRSTNTDSYHLFFGTARAMPTTNQNSVFI